MNMKVLRLENGNGCDHQIRKIKEKTIITNSILFYNVVILNLPKERLL